MPIVVNSNASATSASFNLSRANDSLRSSLERLSSGKRINSPADDAGGLAVAYKIKSEGSRSLATIQNTRNALSYLQVQDGAMSALGKIFARMSQLRTMASDITKNSGDVENYSKEFVELQFQLDQISNQKFNGMSLFASNGAAPLNNGTKGTGTYRKNDGSVVTYEKFGRQLQLSPSSGERSVSINVINLEFVASYDALALPNVHLVQLNGSFYADRITDFPVSIITDVIEKIADARAENGAEQNRVMQALDFLEVNYANLEAAHGRIMDADIAIESTRFARSNVLVQSGAAMTAQANQLPNIVLTLIK
jgi:flagellin